jgi:hypothetical protein
MAGSSCTPERPDGTRKIPEAEAGKVDGTPGSKAGGYTVIAVLSAACEGEEEKEETKKPGAADRERCACGEGTATGTGRMEWRLEARRATEA